jgi:ribosomal protein L11 methyltransferase
VIAPASAPTPSWLVVLDVPDGAAARFMAALEPFCVSVAAVRTRDPERTRIEGIAAGPPPAGALGAALALAAASVGIPEPRPETRPLEPKDWLEVSRRAWPPIRVGRFFLKGSHFEGRAPAGSVPLTIDAGTAFGTGRHESTMGCLLALDRLGKSLAVARALDVGCGSGVLALAVAKTWKARVLACDIDPEAVRVTWANAARNGLSGLVRVVLSDGVRAAAAKGGAPYDLVTANILAKPLVDMACGIARLAAPGGAVVLSGILGVEGNEVLSAYRSAGLRLLFRLDIGGWCTLVLGRRPAAASKGA